MFEDDLAIKNIGPDQALDLLDYPAYFSLTKTAFPHSRDAIIAKLVEESIIVERAKHYHITNLGAILFAKDLRQFNGLVRKAVRVILYKGVNRIQTVKEYIALKGYAAGFETLIEYINDKLPSNEEIGRVFRKEVRMYPEIAVRELVANALIHQDFLETGTGPMVEIFEDRIEISNPGRPLIDTLRFIDHCPRSRNEKIASFMRRMNICEERGSGIDKVINEVELYQLPAPDFVEYDTHLKVVLCSTKELSRMEKKDKIRACYQHYR